MSDTSRSLLFVYLLALIPRLVLVSFIGHAPLSLDEIEFDRLAWSLSEGKGFLSFFDLESTFRAPFYPSFLAAIYLITGPDYFIARLMQCFVSACVAPLTYLLALQVSNKQSAVIAAIISGLYPGILLLSNTLMSENITIPLLLLTLLVCLKFFNSDLSDKNNSLNWPLILLCSLVFSALIMLRPSLLPLLLIYLLWLYVIKHKQALTGTSIILIAAIMMLPITSWSVRNFYSTGQFIFLDSRTGYNLFIGYNDKADGSFSMESADYLLNQYLLANIREMAPELNAQQARSLLIREANTYKTRVPLDHSRLNTEQALPDVWVHNYGKQQSLEFIYKNPIKSLSLIPIKLAKFWNLEQRIFIFAYSNNVIGKIPDPLLLLLFTIILAPFPILVLLSLAHLSLVPTNIKQKIILLPLLYLSLVHALTFGDSRFHFLIVPILAIFASSQIIALSGHPHMNTRTSKQKKLFVFGTILFCFVWAQGLWNDKEKWQRIFSDYGNQSHLKF